MVLGKLCRKAAFVFLARVFSEKSQGIAIPWYLHAKALTFCNISVITEDIYLKLCICVHYLKSNPYY